MNAMKFSGILIFVAICISFIAPVTMHLAVVSADRPANLVTLDVCHMTDSSLSVNSDSPSIHECPCRYVPLAFAGFHEDVITFFVPYLASVQHERPPRV